MAIDMFVKIAGVTGESADSNHRGWIDIVGYTWGAEQRGTMAGGGGGGSGKAAFSDLYVNTIIDNGTSALTRYCATGKHIEEVKLSICKVGGTQIEFSAIVLKDVFVTDVKFCGGTNDEQIHADYGFRSSQVEFHYWVQSQDGTRGAESQMGWDVKANKATA